MKKLTTLLLALLMLSLAVTASAATVTYEGGAEAFVFLPGSEYTDTDLFENFKGVMPGDKITQRILLRNDTNKWVRIYMRADPVEDVYRDFLSQLNLEVTCKEDEIFDAAASETAQLTENTLLGTFTRSGTAELMVTLTVPVDLGNEFMNTIGIVPWTFLVEELPDDYTPETGDTFELSTWLLAAALILGAIAFVLIRMKRQKAAN